MRISGYYEKDDNFTTIYSGNKIYTVTRNSGVWGCIPVGGRDIAGNILTQTEYDRRRNACPSSGSFDLD